jgi:hypothetical protein
MSAGPRFTGIDGWIDVLQCSHSYQMGRNTPARGFRSTFSAHADAATPTGCDVPNVVAQVLPAIVNIENAGLEHPEDINGPIGRNTPGARAICWLDSVEGPEPKKQSDTRIAGNEQFFVFPVSVPTHGRQFVPDT